LLLVSCFFSLCFFLEDALEGSELNHRGALDKTFTDPPHVLAVLLNSALLAFQLHLALSLNFLPVSSLLGFTLAKQALLPLEPHLQLILPWLF
jgi:hypothetical protein